MERSISARRSRSAPAAGAPDSRSRRVRPRRLLPQEEHTSSRSGVQRDVDAGGGDDNDDDESLPTGVSRDRHGRLSFTGYPQFKPNLTPRQVIQAGGCHWCGRALNSAWEFVHGWWRSPLGDSSVAGCIPGSFGGCYFHPRGGKPGILHPHEGVAITHEEFPQSWFDGLAPNRYRSRRYDASRNKYGVKCGRDQAFWEAKGWIRDQDPRGWFQWYCRFFCGRRTEDDARQISRWVGVTGEKGRWKRNLLNKCIAAGAAVDDHSVSPVVRQVLLHWAYELSEVDMLAFAAVP